MGFVGFGVGRIARAGLASCSLLAAAAAMPAQAASCYDVFGCTNRNSFRFGDLMDGPNCQFLYVMRNQIYRDHGYCFHTPRAISELGNDGCYISDMGRVPLSGVERGNAATILRAEQAKGCPQ